VPKEKNEDFIVWKCGENIVGDYGFTLELPTGEDKEDSAWFNVKLNNGLQYTIYDLRKMIDYCIPGLEDDAIEQWEDNKYINQKAGLVKFLAETVDQETAQTLAKRLWGEYQFKDPDEEY